MRLTLLLLCFALFTTPVSSQSYLSMNLDSNSDLSETATIGFGVQLQAPLKKNWYLNWHYSIGGSTDGDTYFRGNALTLLYKSPDYWRYTPGPTPEFGDRFWNFVFCAIFPIVCPDGVTAIIPPLHEKIRMGFYCNPLLADYWFSSHKIRSWTLEGGIRLFTKPASSGTFHLSLGAARVHNTANYEGADYRDGWMMTLSLGIGLQMGDME